MNHTKQFIKDAIEGGYPTGAVEENQHAEISGNGMYCNGVFTPVERLLLNPTAWQAVGKTRNWKYNHDPENGSEREWFEKWQWFIFYLSMENDIENALAAISE